MKAIVLTLFAALSTAAFAQDALSTAMSITDVHSAGEDLLSGRIDSPDDAARAARVLLAARDYERAERLFEAAYLGSAGRDLESLFYQALMLLELGDTVGAERRARLAVEQTEDYELKRRAYTLMARALHLRGESEAALPMLLTLAELQEPELVEPETLLLLEQVLSILGHSEEQALTSAGAPVTIAEIHPESIAAMRTTDLSLRYTPMPSNLASLRDVLPATPQEAITESGASIQVGSFSDPENAMHLADDLRELDLPAEVSVTERDGRELSIVLIRLASRDAEEVAQTMEALAEAGYAGFLND